MIVLLALAWLVVLVPVVARPRLESSPLDGVRSFEQAMGILANTRGDRQQMPGRWVMVPKGMGQGVKTRRHRLVRKRRLMFERLVLALGATLVLGLIPPLRALWWASLVMLVVTAGYAAMLRRWYLNEQQRNRIVRPLHDDTHVEQDVEAPESATPPALDDDAFDVVLPRRAAR